MVKYKEVPGHPNYLIYPDGRLWSKVTKKFRVFNINRQGYYLINLNGKSKMKHRLLAENFLPNPKNLREVNHINGIKTDNKLSNLEWCTSSHNRRHAYTTGLKVPSVGVDHPQSKVTNKDVIEIRKLKGTKSYKKIGEMFGIKSEAVYSIIARRTWKHII